MRNRIATFLALSIAGICLQSTRADNLPLQGDKYVIVAEGTNDVHRGSNLRSAYSTATTLNPAATNRVIVIVPPGNYNLNGSDLTMNSNYVDLVGLVPCQMTGKQVFTDPNGTKRMKTVAKVHCPVRIFGASVSQSAGDVTIQSLIISNYYPTVVSTNTVLQHVSMTSMRTAFDFAGQYIDCVGGDNSFAGGDQLDEPRPVASGTFIDCVAGVHSFGGEDDSTASGVFVNCTGKEFCFGGSEVSTASGVFIRCLGGTESFGGAGGGAIVTGTFIECVSGCCSFAGDGTASGTFIDCTGEYSCFGGGYGTLAGSAVLRHCAATGTSFGSYATSSGDFNYNVNFSNGN